MSDFSFKVNGADIKTHAPAGVEIIVRDVIRPMIKPKTSHKVSIPGRAHSWDFGGEVVIDFSIIVELLISAKNDYADALTCARTLETVLDGELQLIFDDEEDQQYTVKIFDVVNMNKEGTTGIALRIDFECSDVTDITP